jgi:hypothetical protein
MDVLDALSQGATLGRFVFYLCRHAQRKGAQDCKLKPKMFSQFVFLGAVKTLGDLVVRAAFQGIFVTRRFGRTYLCRGVSLLLIE